MATFNLGCKVDLRKIAQNCRNCEYNPRRFAACTMRITQPKATALIFSSGKVVCTGTKSEEECKTAAKIFVKALRKVEYWSCALKDFKIQNIVASSDI